MGDFYWIGGAAAVQQEDHFTPANVEIGDIFTLTATGEDGSTKVISFTATATTVANVTAGLAAAWNASSHPLAKLAIASDQTTYVKLLAATAGVPFYVASSTTDGGGTNTQTLTRAATIASQGPNDWNTTLNWSGLAVPVNSDNLTFDSRGSAYAVSYGLNQSGVTLGNLYIDQSFTNNWGTTAAAVRLSASEAWIGRPPGDGSSPAGSALIHWDPGSTAYTLHMINSRANGTSGLPAVNLKGSHLTNNKIYQSGGNLGIAAFIPGSLATASTISVSGGSLVIGGGASWTTIINNGGTLNVQSTGTTITQQAGTLTTSGGGAVAPIGTITLNGGRLFLNHRPSAGATVTTLNQRNAARVDLTQDERALTITTYNFRAGSLLTFSSAQLTITNFALDQDVNTIFNLTASPGRQ